MINYKSKQGTESYIKILHFADFQYEVRSNVQRFDEYKFHNNKMVSACKKHRPNMIVICGDIYELAYTVGVNNTEIFLFRNLLKELLESFDGNIIITTGNHDIKQKDSYNRLNSYGKVEPFNDGIEVAIDGVSDDRIKYLKYTDNHIVEYKGDELQFIVHSQYNKHLKYLDGEYIYNGEFDKDGFVVDLFHDPLLGNSVGFDGRINEHLGKYDQSIFKGNSVLAGDIHYPQIHHLGTNNVGKPLMFAYSSSSCMRNFGEGDYYNNNSMFQRGSDKHGYMIWDLDSSGSANSIEFYPIEPYTNLVTINLTKECLSFDLEYSSRVKIKSSINAKSTIEFKNIIQNNPLCIGLAVEGNFVVDSEDIEVDPTVDFSKDKLKDIALGYVDSVVEKSKGLDKIKAKSVLSDIISNSFDKLTINKVQKSIDIKSLKVKNFLGLRESEIEFKDLLRIHGTNGGGKTTNGKALIWCVTGKISGKEKGNQKVKNLQSLKNRLNDDELFVSVELECNGDFFKITRTVNFDKKPKEIINVVKNGEVVSYSDLNKYLEGLFPFDEFSEILKTTKSLEGFIKTDSKTLRSKILNRIGIDAVESLDKEFNTIKEDFLSSYPIPKYKSEHYTTHNGNIRDEISLLLESKKKIESDINKYEVELSNLKYNISDNEVNLKKLEKSYDDECEKSYNKIVFEIENIDSALLELGNKISSYDESEYLDAIDDIKTASDLINKKSVEASNLNSSISQLSMELIKVNEEISNLKLDGSTKKSEIKEDYNKDVQCKIEDLNNSIKYLSKIQLEYSTKWQNIESENNKIEKNVEILELENEFSESKITHLNQMCENLCKNCGKPHGANEKDLSEINVDLDGLKLKIHSNKIKIEELNSSIKTIEEHLDFEDIKITEDSIHEAEHRIETLKTEQAEGNKIKEILNSHYSIRAILKKLNEKVSDSKKIKDKISTQKNILNDLNIELEPLLEELEILKEQQESLSAEKVKIGLCKEQAIIYNLKLYKLKDELLKSKIDYEMSLKIKTSINDLKSLRSEMKNVLVELKSKIKVESTSLLLKDAAIASCEKEIETNKDFIMQIEERSMATKIMNVLKKIVSGDGLPLYIFNSISVNINKRMADILVDFPFTLSFKDGELYKYDKRNGKVIEIPIQHISGMEIAMGGLVLDEVIDSLNDEWLIKFRFIDELSGQLSNGEGLKNSNNLNFRDMYKDILLLISKNKKVCFVDHVLSGVDATSIEFGMSELGGIKI